MLRNNITVDLGLWARNGAVSEGVVRKLLTGTLLGCQKAMKKAFVSWGHLVPYLYDDGEGCPGAVSRDDTPWAMLRLEDARMRYTRITVSAEQMGGVPCIRGLRIPVATVVGMVAERFPWAEILKAYPDLEEKDIAEALQYAAEAVRERDLPMLAAV